MIFSTNVVSGLFKDYVTKLKSFGADKKLKHLKVIRRPATSSSITMDPVYLVNYD
jgi:hypothetical protein